MVTIHDIAKKTGFSISTVSKVLNNYSDISEKTRKAIFKAVNEMGYYPNSNARALSTKKSWTVGVVFDEDDIGMEHPFFNAVTESFKKSIGFHGYDLLFASNRIGNVPKTYLDHFRFRDVDGVIVINSVFKDEDVERLMLSDVPSVFIDLDSRHASGVYSDNQYGSELAVNYLLSLGHTRIAHIAGSQKLYAGVERKKGFIEAMNKSNINVNDDYIVDAGYFDYESGQEAMKKLLLCDPIPTAVYVSGDMMALGAICEINNAGLKVPDDISIIGFDDIQLARYTTPRLTTIRQDTQLIGKMAANLLLEQINDKKKCDMSVKIPVTLIERNSCRSL
ncbi:LacI family DNA-binding transcriptional regulator [Evansella cellulosilytica]|uniref:Transcriptional regulator, LacI family n=1 Tax=Evansella cellulosilytica (strain ATCC 21833 / DSM 2522 / FERM P-1141 / JCM 9156 / N-4) TaxID=649639 RepID=E6TZ97_EVAC2|nr:LacI family DNA-binding transcriptional regulator [Evansella cellulosilytica]ADU28959.1 transcriptional regulator, LacI family [Evansella cellulosilytica DSM 2522]